MYMQHQLPLIKSLENAYIVEITPYFNSRRYFYGFLVESQQ